jgi:hypothetical protein
LIRRNQRNERERKKKAGPSFLELETLNIKLKDLIFSKNKTKGQHCKKKQKY